VASTTLFLDEGAKVMLVDLDGAALTRTVADLASPNVAAVAADVSQAAGARAYIERAVARFGPIDVLFSNAGNQGPVVPVTSTRCSPCTCAGPSSPASTGFRA
jgi:NAD(P)-dependent dehydrogenase (short-subunit alcohol dehydrogenase family)